MAKSRADIANTTLRIFLQDVGEAYDHERGFAPYQKKNFAEVRSFFDNQCCYCGGEFSIDRVAEDHLIPINKSELGLHAWGNVVPACAGCNAGKQGKPWHEYLALKAGSNTSDRYQRIKAFVSKYKYDPDITHLREIADDLYQEVGEIATALLRMKVNRALGVLKR